MTLLTKKDILRSLDEVIGDSDVYLLQGGVWSFGSLLDIPIKDIPRFLIDILLEFNDNKKTILLPAYTNSFCRSKVFDLIRSRPSTGILSIFAVYSKLFTRTCDPINSYLVHGPLTEEILNLDYSTLWGEGSVFNYLEDKGKICIMGVTWDKACSFYHRIEEKFGVDYRYHKTFSGKLLSNDEYLSEVSKKMYVRPMNFNIDWDYKTISDELEARGLINRSSNVNVPISSASCSDILSVGLQMLSQDPYYFAYNKQELKEWLDAGMLNKEIDELLNA